MSTTAPHLTPRLTWWPTPTTLMGERWGPRTLDLDIVRFGTRRLRDADLRIPHLELPNRDWWQREIEEVDRLAPARTSD